MAAAWLAALWSYRSLQISRRQLSISAQQEEDRLKPLSLSIVDSFNQAVEGSDSRVFAFGLLFTNPADRPNSIAKIELLVDFEVTDGQLMTGVFAARSVDAGPVRALEVPLDLGPRATASGWCFFEVEARLRIDNKVRGYRVVATDASGVEVTARAVIVRDVVAPTEVEG